MKKRFWKRKDMIPLEFKVLGLDFQSNSSVLRYVIYFSAYENKMCVYFLTKKQYEDFQEGKFAITEKPEWNGTRGAVGEKLVYIQPIDMNKKINKVCINRMPDMKKALSLAKEIVERSEV